MQDSGTSKKFSTKYCKNKKVQARLKAPIIFLNFLLDKVYIKIYTLTKLIRKFVKEDYDE